MKLPQRRRNSGFTLIELLVVITILTILSTVVYVALDPPRRFRDSRNANRVNDVNSILTAVHQYFVDNGGSFPPGLTTSMPAKQIGTCTSGGATLCTGAAASCVNLATPLARYLKSMPVDKKTGSAATTGYSIEVDANNIVTVRSCSAEGITVQVSR